MKRPFTTTALAALPPGFQIAPMIDIVFVIMLFFMVMAGMVKAERELKMKLPTKSEQASTGKAPVEVTLSIDEDETVALNEEPMPLSSIPPALLRLRNQTANPVLVTLEVASFVRYQRMMDVLDALSNSGFSNVTIVIIEEPSF